MCKYQQSPFKNFTLSTSVSASVSQTSVSKDLGDTINHEIQNNGSGRICVIDRKWKLPTQHMEQPSSEVPYYCMLFMSWSWRGPVNTVLLFRKWMARVLIGGYIYRVLVIDGWLTMWHYHLFRNKLNTLLRINSLTRKKEKIGCFNHTLVAVKLEETVVMRSMHILVVLNKQPEPKSYLTNKNPKNTVCEGVTTSTLQVHFKSMMLLTTAGGYLTDVQW